MPRKNWPVPKGAVELEERRSAHAAHFRLPDGQYMAIIGKNRHYKGDDGKLYPRDIVFKLRGPDRYTVDDAPYRLEVTDTAITIVERETGAGVSWLLSKKPVVTANVVRAEISGVPWEYQLGNSGIKATCTVNAKQGPKTYQFPYRNEGGLVLAVTELGDVVGVGTEFRVPRPVVHLANRQIIQAGSWRIEAPGVLAFDFDDSTLGPDAFPYVIDPTSNFAPSLDGHIWGSADSWPVTETNSAPFGGISVDTSLTFFEIDAILSAGQYQHRIACIRFDTSALPDNATITSAVLRVYVTAQNNNEGFAVNGEWYDPGNTLGTEDYASAVGSSAFQSSAPGLTMGWNDITLGGLTNINKIGFSGIRIGFDVPTGGPNQANYVAFSSSESANDPLLIVTYTVPAIDGAAAVTCAASTSAAGLRVALGAASVACASVASATGKLVAGGASSVTCTASASANGGFRVSASSSVACAVTVAASGRINKLGSSSVVAFASAQATGLRCPIGSGSAQATATVTGAASVKYVGAASVAGVVAASGIGSVYLNGIPARTVASTTASATAMVIRTSAASVTIKVGTVAVATTAFEKRSSQRRLAMPMLPRYPSKKEEVLEWAQWITRSIDTAFRILNAREQNAITVGRLADMPAPSNSQTFYWAVDDNAGQGRLYFDDGTWRPV